MDLKGLLNTKGISVYKLSEYTCIPKTTLYEYTRGNISIEQMPVGMFIKIAKALELNNDEVLMLLNI